MKNDQKREKLSKHVKNETHRIGTLLYDWLDL